MGAWGVKVDDNDLAQDFILDYEHLINEGKNCREAIKYLLDNEYTYSSEAMLIAAKLEFECYGKIEDTEEIKDVLIDEISREKLSNWVDPDKRKLELLNFAKYIGVL